MLRQREDNILDEWIPYQTWMKDNILPTTPFPWKYYKCWKNCTHEYINVEDSVLRTLLLMVLTFLQRKLRKEFSPLLSSKLKEYNEVDRKKNENYNK